MTWFEAYALFGVPLVAFAVGLGIYFWASRSADKHEATGE